MVQSSESDPILYHEDNKIYYPVDTYAKNAVLITDNPLHLNDYLF